MSATLPGRLDPASATVYLRARDPETARAFFTAAREQGAFMLELDSEPKALTSYPCQLEVGGEDSGFSVEARVVQLFPAGGGCRAVFELPAWPEARTAELERKLSALGSSDGTAVGGGTEEGTALPAGETQGASPLFRIKEMNPNERMRLATKAGRVERQILRRDHSAQVLMGLLANPRSEAEDVLAVVKSTQANGALLKRVATDPRWSKNAEIRTALVRNPKTPAPLAIQLLDTLPISELRTMSKMGALRENVRKAALRLYLKRMGGR